MEHADQPSLPDFSHTWNLLISPLFLTQASSDIFRENKEIYHLEKPSLTTDSSKAYMMLKSLTEDIIDGVSAQLQSMSLQVISCYDKGGNVPLPWGTF